MNPHEENIPQGLSAGSLFLRSGPAQARTQSLCQERIFGQARDLQLFLLALSPQSHHRTSDRENPALGVPGVDILHRQMDGEDPAHFVNSAPRLLNGVDLICLSIHQDFVSPDANPAKISSTPKMHPARSRNGHPLHPAHSGRWGTARNFNHLMELRWQRAGLPGHTEEEGRWCIDSSKNAPGRSTAFISPSRTTGDWPHPRRPPAYRPSDRLSLAGRPHGHRKFYGGPTTSSRKSLPSPPSWPRPIEAVMDTLDLDYPRVPRSCPKSATTDTFHRVQAKPPPGKACLKASSFASGFS